MNAPAKKCTDYHFILQMSLRGPSFHTILQWLKNSFTYPKLTLEEKKREQCAAIVQDLALLELPMMILLSTTLFHTLVFLI